VGRLRAKTSREGVIVNGVTLGNPPITLIDGSAPGPGDSIAALWFVWDDPRLPNGEVHANGTVELDPEPAP